MTSFNSSLNNLRGRSSDGRGSMPNLPSSGATNRGASRYSGNLDEVVRKQQKELDKYARQLRLLTLNSPSSRIPSQTQYRGRPSSRERGTGVSFAGTPQRSRHTFPSSEDDGGSDNDREISKKDNDTVRVVLSSHRDIVFDLGRRMLYSNCLLIVMGYNEVFAKVNLTIRDLFKGQFLPPVQMGKLADAVLKLYIGSLAQEQC
jgi:hypothetical protein